jgi:acyl-CoA thioesterase-1
MAGSMRVPLSSTMTVTDSIRFQITRRSLCLVLVPAVFAAGDARPVVAAFGNSLSAGFGAEAGKSYPDYLQKLLDAKGYKYRVVNAGVSGDTSTDGVERIGEVLAAKPAVVILELGGNDGLRGLPVAGTKANLEQLIVALRKSGATVVLAGITLPRNYGATYIQSFDRIYTDLAKQYKLTLVPFLLQGVAVSGPGLMQQDGIHPTAAGNEKVAATVFRYVAPLLKK